MMAGSIRFESSTAGPEDLGFARSYQNGLRGSYPSGGLDRSGSFRESGENRVYGSAASTPRTNASSVGVVPPVTQCLLLDPIAMGDQKYTRLGEVRRALGISLGGTKEDSSFGAAHSKLSPPLGSEELKRFKASVTDASFKARVRIKRLNESLFKLNKYCEALNLKKHQRNELTNNERSDGSNLLKMGFQLSHNSSDLGTQRLEEQTKSGVLNKRIRSSMAELRVGSNLERQSAVMGKDRDMLRDGGEGSDVGEEKVHRLAAGGEGWDKKMKRKRSMGTVFARPTDNDVEAKCTAKQKFSIESGVQSYDSQSFRSGCVNGSGCFKKSDGTSSPGSSNVHTFHRNEVDKISLTRDLAVSMNKERYIPKMNNKLNVVEDDHVSSPSLVTKAKASRALRTGSAMAANLSPNFPRTAGGLDGCELSPNLTKTNSIGGPNNHKRLISTGSSSPPMAQWVGQRPQKISRTRRANVVSPVSNHDGVQSASEGGQPSDCTAREASVGISPKDSADETHQVKVKHEMASSPLRLCEEKSGAAENQRGTCGGAVDKFPNPNVGPVLLTKKIKGLNKEDNGNGVRRQGRTARIMTPSRASISPTREKLENPPSKPFKISRLVSDKNGSKSGRPPVKKMSDRKGVSRLGQLPAGSSPDFTGESDDDHEELLAAANCASGFSYLSCSGSFWKKVEPVFASISVGDFSCLKQLMSSAEECERLVDIFSRGTNDLGDLVHEGYFHSQPGMKESERSLKENHSTREFLGDLANQVRDNGTSFENHDRRNNSTPLYQRLLSALIREDEYEDLEENRGSGKFSNPNTIDRSPSNARLSIDFELTNGIEYDYSCMTGFQSWPHPSAECFLSNGFTTKRFSGLHSQLCDDALFHGSNGFTHSKTGVPNRSFGNDDATIYSNGAGLSAMDCQYEHLCLEDELLMELQSIGLYLENMPDLVDGENEAINKDILELHKRLHQQTGKKKEHLANLIKAVEEGKTIEERSFEQVAMDRLVESAYIKQLATRGSSAAKMGVPRVSKHFALAFMKRTLARCRRFEGTGKSCFSEPIFQDVVSSAVHRGKDAESVGCIGLADTTNMPSGTSNSYLVPGLSVTVPAMVEQLDLHADSVDNAHGTVIPLHDQDFSKTEPMWNRGRKKELLLDDVGVSSSFRAELSLGNSLLGGAKGKRSERENSMLGRSSVTKKGRTAQNNVKSDRKTKSKVKQKTAQLSTPEDGANNKFKEANSNEKREAGILSNAYKPQDSAKDGKETTEITDLQELDTELGVSNQFSEHQDLSSWFDGDGLPENEADLDLSMVGLDIPMDDLTKLNVYF